MYLQNLNTRVKVIQILLKTSFHISYCINDNYDNYMSMDNMYMEALIINSRK